MLLTTQEILSDIAEYENRILTARSRLERLPDGRLDLKAHKKRERKRYSLHEEIKHVGVMLGYAKEALSHTEA